MNYDGKRVGIWGFGTTGKSLLTFFAQQRAHIQVLDARVLNHHDQQVILKQGASIRDPKDIISFLNTNDYIVPSPGIDLRPYHGLTRYVSEIDLFVDHFAKPFITVTGSSGKSTVVTLLQQLMSTDTTRIVAGGNIGYAMLDLLNQEIDGAILELSSFQLELSTRLMPDLAIWTNLYENHLDRHETMQNYCLAKSMMLVHQKPGQRALLPLALYHLLPSSITQRPDYAFFTQHRPTPHEYALISSTQALYYMHNTTLYLLRNGQEYLVYSTPRFSSLTYPENWLVIAAALHMLGIPLDRIDTRYSTLTIPDYRLQHVATIHGVSFYNDSKSTIPASTKAAVQSLAPSPIVLFLGGISKGIDRQQLIKELVGNVRYVLCFGAEAAQLATWCNQYGIANSAHATLQEAFATCMTSARTGDAVVFSPAGASFDLFANYNERGELFKTLVMQHVKPTCT